MTDEDFIKILPAYIGCKAMNNKSGVVETMWDIRIVLRDKPTAYVDCETFHYIDEFKLILRPISEDAEEEKVHCHKLFESGNQRLINYLRSLSIDVDGLVAAGRAIKEIK